MSRRLLFHSTRFCCMRSIRGAFLYIRSVVHKKITQILWITHREVLDLVEMPRKNLARIGIWWYDI